MVRIMCTWLIAISCTLVAAADEFARPPAMVEGAPAANNAADQGSAKPVRIKTITIYDSKVFPGFRSCTSEDYRNQDRDPIVCQDDDVARMLSAREENDQTKDLVVEGDAAPQGNIYKLRFERFKTKSDN